LVKTPVLLERAGQMPLPGSTPLPEPEMVPSPAASGADIAKNGTAVQPAEILISVNGVWGGAAGFALPLSWVPLSQPYVRDAGQPEASCLAVSRHKGVRQRQPTPSRVMAEPPPPS